jgi:hypothetical protein
MKPYANQAPSDDPEPRLAVDHLPRDTPIAMLEGIRTNQVVVGAYTTDDGVCPMLAAHRAGERTSAISFARAWDRSAFRHGRDRRPRLATERELLVLITHLEASLLEEGPAGLSEALAERRELIERRGRRANARVPATAGAIAPFGARAPATRLRERDVFTSGAGPSLPPPDGGARTGEALGPGEALVEQRHTVAAPCAVEKIGDREGLDRE